MKKLLLLAACAACSASRTSAPETKQPAPNFQASSTRQAELVSTSARFEDQRFFDIDQNPYSDDFIRTFSYPQAGENRAMLTYTADAPVFRGHVQLRGLKPNFAYQLKFLSHGREPLHRDSLERIGFLGRWSLPGGGTNFSDSDYHALADKRLASAFLLFDFVITDAQGNAEIEFAANSSWHVLWHTRQRAIHPGDSAAIRGVYAEDEAGRPAQGQAFLPAGHYTVDFVLTEESFHSDRNNRGGGYWATVLRAPVEFDIR